MKTTNTPTADSEWEKEFEHMERNHGWLPEHKTRIKDFIRTLITLTKQEIK